MQLLRKIAFPFSLVYALVVYVRNYLFDVGFLKSKSFKTPIVCVGNLSVGGTGKTPMIEFLISILKDNYKVAVLSRGYKRKSKGFALGGPESTVEELGDEPYQIKSKNPDISLAVDANRRNGISMLEESVSPDVILLDDAFQHRKVKSGFSILLTTYDNLYCDDWYLPTGDLRDSKREAKRANCIIVTKCPQELTLVDQSSILKKLKPNENQKVLFSYLAYEPSIRGNDTDTTLNSLIDKDITLVTGIANPKPLVTYLENKKIPFNHIEFNDHHFFTPTELQTLNSKACILTTEKDYVRLKGKVENLYYITIKHEFLNEGAEFLERTLFKYID